ncbi:ATP-binding protein [Streptomyces atacamensis]|jgi:anti-sigma regulatory factor (Ser/Thr protein kinase)|uniref:ATP-binding protein n=1 Tax=Streptomyces atacamensis TaxID=531966 RepID=UPI00399D0F15
MTDPTPATVLVNALQRARTYELRAPNIPETVKVARNMVAGLLDATGHSALAETARLLVSEVVSNVHLHTKVPLLTLEATVGRDRVRVSVRDDDTTGAPSSPGAGVPPEAEHGRGLLLVRELAAAWGTVWHGGLQPSGKSVWFELRGTRAGRTT